MSEMSLNPSADRYEGLLEDGRLVTVTRARWEREGESPTAGRRAPPLAPDFWAERMMEPEPGIVVWGARSLQAREHLALPGQVFYTARPPLSTGGQPLGIPQAFVRPSPLGYGVQLVYASHAAVLIGHLRAAGALAGILGALGVDSRSGWEIAEHPLAGIPLPPQRPYLDDPSAGVSAEVCGHAAYSMVALLERRLQPDPLAELGEEGRTEGLAVGSAGRLASVRSQVGLAARDVGAWFHAHYAAKPGVGARLASPGRPMPGEGDLVRMAEVALWSWFWQEWAGFGPGEQECNDVGWYLCNAFFQMVRPDAFAPWPSPLPALGA